jgi:Fe-S cluster assembly iron-binding protein IscA
MPIRTRLCFFCDLEVKKDDLKRMVALERPYINLWFHRACYSLIKDNELGYLTANIKKIFKYEKANIRSISSKKHSN